MLRQWNTKTSASLSGMWVAKTKSDLFGDTTSRIHRVSVFGIFCLANPSNRIIWSSKQCQIYPMWWWWWRPMSLCTSPLTTLQAIKNKDFFDSWGPPVQWHISTVPKSGIASKSALRDSLLHNHLMLGTLDIIDGQKQYNCSRSKGNELLYEMSISFQVWSSWSTAMTEKESGRQGRNWWGCWLKTN